MSAEYVNTTSGLIILRRECVIYRFTIKDSFHQNILGKIIFRTVILQKIYIYMQIGQTLMLGDGEFILQRECVVCLLYRFTIKE